MGRFLFFFIIFIFPDIAFSINGGRVNLKRGLGEYDPQNVGHHDEIKSDVEIKPISRCPDRFGATNLTFTVVCGRKTKTPVIGNCLWEHDFLTGNGKAKFLRKPRKITSKSNGNNEEISCGCGIADYSSETAPSCPGLNIEDSRQGIFILATSPTSKTIRIGSRLEFWIEYMLIGSNWNNPIASPADGHSLFIKHWYNTIFTKGSWHLIHSYHDEESASDNTTIPHRYSARMRIDSVTLDESGIYTFEITTGQLAATLAFVLNVQSDDTPLHFFTRRPVIDPNRDQDPFKSVNSRFLEFHSRYEIICAATIGNFDQIKGHQTKLSLYWTACSIDSNGRPQCPSNPPLMEKLALDNFRKIDPNGREFSYRNHSRHLAIVYTVEAIDPSLYDCAISSGSDENETADRIRVIPVDIPEASEKKGMEVRIKTDFANNVEIAYNGDGIIFECRYQSIDYRFQRWQFIGDQGHFHTIIHNTSRFILEFHQSTPTTSVSRLILAGADEKRDSGNYICELIDLENGGKAVNFGKRISVIQPVSPAFTDDREILHFRVNETDSMTLQCLINANASPTPTISWTKNGQVVHEFDNMQEMQFRRISKSDAGNYTCTVKNRANTIRKEFLMTVLSARSEQTAHWSLLIALIVLLVFVLVLGSILIAICVKSYRKRKMLTELHQQLISSTKENLAYLDPSLPVNRQPENLPYDSQFEISMDQLLLGVGLGEGQFGKVVEGYVFSEDRERSMRVAVKMPRDGMDICQQRMLLSEFKIMAFVGSHVNVVRLVATVTHRIPKGELYVATEYCEHGSLRDYLIQRRSVFHDELTMGGLDSSGYILSNEFIRRSRSQMTNSLTNHGQDDQSKQLSTADLLGFAYQVANGMDYLASKNVVHRDLALRNVLLTKDMLVKIGDFGLALNQWEDEKRNVLMEGKRSNVPLPVKWMALESMLYGEYSVYSDIWSFGIVLWEIFSLGEIPYPGKAPNVSLAEWLLSGNRLPPPKYAPEYTYLLMTQCWRDQPAERPSFPECRDRIEFNLGRRWPKTLEMVRNLLDGYHAYVNVQGSIVNDDDSPSARLLGGPPVLAPFSSSLKISTVENPSYDRTTVHMADAVENQDYSKGGSQDKKVDLV